MVEIIENLQIGNYYLELLPWVENMNVSYNRDTDTYSLECDTTYNSVEKIGSFTGYPGKFDKEGKLIIGLVNANGLVYVNKTEFYEISNGIIQKGNFDEYNKEESKESEESQLHIRMPSRIVGECTSIQTGVNKNSELLVHLRFNPNINTDINTKSYGIFSGTPGEYYYDEVLKQSNRRYGNEYSSGTIILNGPYDFKYNYNKGQVIQYNLNYKNIYTLKGYYEMFSSF